jgi:hypothetical protein
MPHLTPQDQTACIDFLRDLVRIRPPAYFYRNLMQRLKWNL